ncbi:hypothetical protein D9M69_460830 [compost metagenome]
MGADHETAYRQQARHHDCTGCPTAFGKAIEETPEIAQPLAMQFLVFLAQGTGGCLATDSAIGQQHRQQHQVGEDQYGYANAGGDRQVLDHRNVDQQQHGEAHGIGQQCGEASEEQAAKGVARSHQLVGAASDVLHDAVHLLGAMGHADGKHQERHQDRERIKRITQQCYQPKLPGHGNH